MSNKVGKNNVSKKNIFYFIFLTKYMISNCTEFLKNLKYPIKLL